MIDYQKLQNRRQSKFQEQLEKRQNRMISKRESSLFSAISRVKEEADRSTWCTAHDNCFTCTFGPGESEAHIDAKFQRWKHWRKHGATVFTEVRWKDGGGRSDLVICLNNGEVFIEEIVCSEKEQSLMQKEDKYPFRFEVIKVDK